ncbi:MAG: hypothetical protein JOY71_17040 [Acetobacteraceae bacterium]|nr:hypothetical protein [Acetobacteraceae bacterium]
METKIWTLIHEFRKSLRGADPEEVVEKWLLAPGARHVSQETIALIQGELATGYCVPTGDVQIWVTGSAKLGFSISEKRTKDGAMLPRYRVFSAESDIDVAVVSQAIFELVWRELSLHSHRQPRFPWDAGKLADYLVCGWLRPDHFPKHVRLYWCDIWWEIFRRLSADPRLRRRRVRGGLFYSIDQLRSYMARAVSDCVTHEQFSVRVP